MEPTDTFMVQAEIYAEDRDEDLLELRQLKHAATVLIEDGVPESDTDGAGPGLKFKEEPERHEHLAAIYDEVAELRSQASILLPRTRLV